MTETDEVRRQAFRFLARRPHTRDQLARKLTRRHSPESVERVLDQLQALGLLDDRAVALERARFGREDRRWGDARIRADLKAQGIDDKMIDSVMLEINHEGSEQQALEVVVRSWTRRRGTPATRGDIKKLFDHCMRRGFASERVRNTLEPFWTGLE